MKKLDISKFITHSQLKKDLMKSPGFRHEYEKLKPEFEIANQMIGARIKNKMSQEDLAKKAGTGQAVISRLEGMNASPSLALLKRIAEALGTKFEITIQ
jgi:DNA-binding XRE family transcriptional regulator